MRLRRDAALRSLKLMLVASVALPFLLFCYAGWINYHAAFALADERIERAGDIAAEQALRVFQSISVTFDSVEQITRGRTDQTIKLNAAELSERLKQFGVSDATIADIEAGVMKEVNDATEACKAAPMPPLDILTTDVYADGGWAWRN